MKHLLMFVVLTVATNAYPSIVSCDKDITLNNLYEKAANDSLDIVKRTMSVTHKITRFLDDRDSKNDEPIINSMNKEQVAEFAKMQARMWTLKMEELIASRRLRDALIILDLIKSAENSYLGIEQEKMDQEKLNKLLKEEYYEDLIQEKNEIPYAEIRSLIFIAMSESEDDLKGSFRYKDDKCSVIALLVDKQNTILERLDDIDQNTLNKYREFKQKLENKYKGKNFSLDILSEDERSLHAHYEKLVLIPSREIINMFRIYEIAKIFIFMNNKIYEADMKDVYLYGGEHTKIGETLNKQVEAGEFTEIELQAMDIWRAMNKLIPPDIMIRSEKISKQRKN